MNIKKITAEILELSEMECCRLYLEIREMNRTVEWVKHNPYLYKLFDILHLKFEGKSLQYMDEFRKILEL